MNTPRPFPRSVATSRSTSSPHPRSGPSSSAPRPAHSRWRSRSLKKSRCARWPTHARYGTRRGTDNTHFLNVELLKTLFLRRLQPYADRVATLIFEFGTFPKSQFPTPDDFYHRLDPFLEAFPGDFGTPSRSATRNT